MNEIIKERLALIQSGTVPKGYKKTKCGTYPENWTHTCMGNCIREYREISNNIQDIPVYSSSRNGLLPQSEYYDGKEATQTNIGYKVVPPNYLTYRHMSDDDVFHFNMNQTGGNILVSSEYPVFTVSDIAELGFILPMLNNAPRFKYFCGMQKLGGTRSRLYFKKLCEYQFYIPPRAEQKKIAEILSCCDRVIELKQQLIVELQRLKSGFLQAMFPAKGHSEPDIRFPEFSDAWEQRKLGEYVSITSGEAPSKFEEGTELYVKVDDLNYNDKYVVDTQNKVAEHSTVKRVTKGSVVFPKRGAAIITNKVRILGIDSYMDTNMMALTSERLDPEFLYNIISKEGLYKIADTSTIPQINNKHIEPYEVKIPSLDEQRRIGVYFKQLDHLITLHQRELEETKKKKKSLAKLLLTGSVRVPT